MFNKKTSELMETLFFVFCFFVLCVVLPTTNTVKFQLKVFFFGGRVPWATLNVEQENRSF